MSCSCMRALRSIVSRARVRVGSSRRPRAKQARPPEHRVQRRAQFVRERREEVLLRAVRGLQILGAAAEIVLEALARGDVTDHEREAAVRPVGVPDDREEDVRVERRATATDADALHGVTARPQRLAQVLPGDRVLAIPGREEARVVATHDFVGLIAEEALAADVPADDLAVGSEHADRVILDAVEQHAQAVLGAAEPFGLAIQLRVQRDDPAVGLLQFDLHVAERLLDVLVVRSVGGRRRGIVLDETIDEIRRAPRGRPPAPRRDTAPRRRPSPRRQRDGRAA